MKLNYKHLFLYVALLGFVVIFMANKQTQNDDVLADMNRGQKIYPAPIPDKLSFVGELVPTNRFQVRERLDREFLVNTYWQSNMMLMLKRSKKAFEVIEPILAAYNIPDDFKYLAVAESGLLNVTSSAGAKGVWQFMKSSGKSYGLEINGEIDERYYLEKSTQAACAYLKKAYAKFGSWTLAAAAYNRGTSGIETDIAKQGVNEYYDLHLNSETARYVFRILAIKSIMLNPGDYGFMINDQDYYGTEETVSFLIDSTVSNIAEFSKSIGSNYHVIKSLNPWILSNQITVKENTYIIKAPLTE